MRICELFLSVRGWRTSSHPHSAHEQRCRGQQHPVRERSREDAHVMRWFEVPGVSSPHLGSVLPLILSRHRSSSCISSAPPVVAHGSSSLYPSLLPQPPATHWEEAAPYATPTSVRPGPTLGRVSCTKPETENGEGAVPKGKYGASGRNQGPVRPPPGSHPSMPSIASHLPGCPTSPWHSSLPVGRPWSRRALSGSSQHCR